MCWRWETPARSCVSVGGRALTDPIVGPRKGRRRARRHLPRSTTQLGWPRARDASDGGCAAMDGAPAEHAVSHRRPVTRAAACTERVGRQRAGPLLHAGHLLHSRTAHFFRCAHRNATVESWCPRGEPGDRWPGRWPDRWVVERSDRTEGARSAGGLPHPGPRPAWPATRLALALTVHRAGRARRAPTRPTPVWCPEPAARAAPPRAGRAGPA